MTNRNWQEYHFKYYCKAVGTVTCPRILNKDKCFDEYIRLYGTLVMR